MAKRGITKGIDHCGVQTTKQIVFENHTDFSFDCLLLIGSAQNLVYRNLKQAEP